MSQALPANSTSPTITPRGFTFFTNYAQVLLLIACDSDLRIRDLAVKIGITERGVQRIIDELQSSGYLVVGKLGRRNQYQVSSNLPLLKMVASHKTVGDLVRFVQEPSAQELTPQEQLHLVS